MTIPLDDPELLTADILPILTSSLRALPFPAETFEGTGFLLSDGFLVTCWHCIATDPPPGHFYRASRGSEEAGYRASPIGFKERLGKDVAWARVNYRRRLDFRLATQNPRMGDLVWTFGYPLTDTRAIDNDLRFFTLHPRLLRGHIVRPFLYQHHALGPLPSWELSFAVPQGLSGAPLFLDGTLDVVGILYGNNDVATVEEQASVDSAGVRTPEVQRIVTFGLAHHLSSLKDLAAAAQSFEPTQLID